MEEEAEELQVEEVEVKTFEELEAESHQVLDEIIGQKRIEKFSEEYVKLINALKKSQKSERTLSKKCNNLRDEMSANTEKVEQALHQSHRDHITILSQQKENKDILEKLTVTSEQLKTTQETNETLLKEIESLKLKLKDHLSLLDEVQNNKRDIQIERDKLQSKVLTLQEKLELVTTQRDETAKEKAKARDTLSVLQDDLHKFEQVCFKVTKEKEKLEKEVKHLHAVNHNQKAEIERLTIACHQFSDTNRTLTHQLSDQKFLNEKMSKDLERQHANITSLQEENDQMSVIIEQLNNKSHQRNLELKMEREQVSRLQQEIDKRNKMTEKKVGALEDQKLHLEDQRDAMKAQLAELESKQEIAQKQSVSDKKRISKLILEKELLSRNLIKTDASLKEHIDLIKLHEKKQKEVDEQILSYRNELRKQVSVISKLERMQDQNVKKNNDLTNQVSLNMMALKAREGEIDRCNKNLAELNTKLKQQQSYHKSTLIECSNYKKNLLDAQHDIELNKNMIKSMSEHNSQLTDEIKNKEAGLVRDQKEFQRINKDNWILTTELQRMAQQVQENKEYINSLEEANQNFKKTIADNEAEKMQLKKELDQVIHERAALKTQMLQQNDELELLRDEIKVQQCILNKGNKVYDLEVEDNRLLKLEIKNLRRENSLLMKNTSELESVKQQLNDLKREWLRERAKCKRLKQELENPTNVHNWRQIEASDPSTFDLIQANHALLRNIISMRKEAEEAERKAKCGQTPPKESTNAEGKDQTAKDKSTVEKS